MGNKTGWIVAGVLVLGVIGIIMKEVFFPSPSSPTSVTLRAEFMDKVDVGVSIATVVGAEPTGAGNAGTDYRAAFDVFKANKEDIVAFLEVDDVVRKLRDAKISPSSKVLSALEAIGRHVAAGAQKAKFEYTLVCTDKKDFEVGYWYQGAFDLGNNVAECMGTLVNYQFGKKQYEQAAQTEKDLMVMGWHMANEGARLHMTLSGLEIQQEALGGLTAVYPKLPGDCQSKIKAVNEYKSAVGEAMAAYSDRRDVLRGETNISADGTVRSRIEPGDILNIAENHKDRAIRVQGILFLGRLRYEASDRGDRRYTQKLIDDYADSKDKFEAAAAEAARQMTEEQWKNLSTRHLRMEQ